MKNIKTKEYMDLKILFFNLIKNYKGTKIYNCKKNKINYFIIKKLK